MGITCPAFLDSGSVEPSEAGELPVKMAGYRLDRVEALIDGRVTPEGCRVTFEIDRIGKMNTHVFSGPRERAVTEIGLSPFMMAHANENFRAYSLLPVFPIRVFRHKSIFIRTDRGIRQPGDLKGKRVAVAGYSSTSLTWIRGMLQHEYGVSPKDLHWVIASGDSSTGVTGGPSKQESVLPKGLTLEQGVAGRDESDLLAEGDVDAVFHAAEPRCYVEGHPRVGRLFSDSRAVEQAYYKKTGIFPIMHAVAIRNDIADQNPWLPRAVFSAYCEAKNLALNRLRKMAWAEDSLPWVVQEVEATRALMGDNYWPYGIEANRKALESLFRYFHEQGLCSRLLSIEDLFHPATLELNEA